ncbi:MAG: pilin [Candidatus Yanofskybacteria bacterium]|nr:pilin [Candidatus Yanofskybacteria bacterium]
MLYQDKGVFSIKNPLEAKDLGEFVSKLTSALFQFAIPIAVGLIIWGGIRILVSRGDRTAFEAGKKIILYAVIGLAVIMIGGGLISLVNSILELGGGSPTQQQKR